MNTRPTRCLSFLVVLIAACAARADTAWSGFRARLQALHPDRPMDYFELAEEIAYEVPGSAGRRMATELLILAGELDRAASSPVPLGRSVCLALADLSTDSAERTWLIAMARSQPPAGEGQASGPSFGGSTRAADASLADEGAQALRTELAMALARFRYADTRQIRAMLDSGDAARALAHAGAPQADAAELLTLLGQRIAELRRARARDSDGRFVRSLSEGATSFTLDPMTGGHPGPVLTQDQTLLVLGIEARLLGARPDSWAADLEVSRRQPVRDINPASLASYFGVDTAKVWFVPDPQRPGDPAAGTWSVTPGPAPSPEEPTDPGVEDQPDQHDREVDDRGDEQPPS